MLSRCREVDEYQDDTPEAVGGKESFAAGGPVRTKAV